MTRGIEYPLQLIDKGRDEWRTPRRGKVGDAATRSMLKLTVPSAAGTGVEEPMSLLFWMTGIETLPLLCWVTGDI